MIFLYYLNRTVVDQFDLTVAQYPNETAIINVGGKSWTFGELEILVNKIANTVYDEGFRPNDTVAVIMENKAEYFAIVLALGKIGVRTAMLNTSIKSKPLAHCIDIVNSSAIIYDSKFEDAVESSLSFLDQKDKLKLYSLSESEPKLKDSKNLLKMLDSAGGDVCHHAHKGNFTDILYYSYTSGTTGLPKAVLMRNARVFYAIYAFINIAWLDKTCRTYVTMPMYHSSAILAAGPALFIGSSTVLRTKFSASAFWREFNEYKCNRTVMVGEIARFLMAQPESRYDGESEVQAIVSVGLKKTLWPKFCQRFNVKQVYEIYGSTEGNSNSINIDNTIGSCGFVPIILPKIIVRLFYPLQFIKANKETGIPIRDRETGFCIPADPDEPALAIGRHVATDAIMQFSGYADAKETEKKYLRNVFGKDDVYFSSGDLLTVDRYGYMYFYDRVGDTFRWRGENVSTNEIETVLAGFLGETECIVYGAEVPGCEGKVGMVSIVDTPRINGVNGVDVDLLLKYLKNHLPLYAIPHFVRFFTGDLPLTGTFKVRKIEFQREAYNLKILPANDVVYWLNLKEMKYEKLTINKYEDFVNAHHHY